MEIIVDKDTHAQNFQTSQVRADEHYTISIVIPAYNEVAVLPEFHRRLINVIDELGANCEIVYVNDGSRDGTLAIMRSIRAGDDRVSIIDMSRNYGKETAMTAGLDHACGDIVVVIDADLQDPPELIPKLVEQWRRGFDVVYAKRITRDGESIVKKITAFMFYRTIQRVSRVDIPPDTGDFRLLSRRAVEAIKQLREHHRFMKGLFAWIGFPQKAVPYRRDSRFAGETKWNYWKLWNFALEGFTSFTIAPLKVATYVGIGVALIAFLFAAWIIYKTLMFGEPVRGYPSLMAVTLFLGGSAASINWDSWRILGQTIQRIKGSAIVFSQCLRNRTPSWVSSS